MITVRPSLFSDCYFKAKLVKYKTESLEGGSLVEQLSAQARQDTALIREQADRIDELQQQLQTNKVRYSTVWGNSTVSFHGRLVLILSCFM